MRVAIGRECTKGGGAGRCSSGGTARAAASKGSGGRHGWQRVYPKRCFWPGAQAFVFLKQANTTHPARHGPAMWRDQQAGRENGQQRGGRFGWAGQHSGRMATQPRGSPRGRAWRGGAAVGALAHRESLPRDCGFMQDTPPRCSTRSIVASDPVLFSCSNGGACGAKVPLRPELPGLPWCRLSASRPPVRADPSGFGPSFCC